MNKRLIWNFEISVREPFIFKVPQPVAPAKNRWEARYFWPENQIIVLNGLDESFLNLSQYQFKHRHDTYVMLPDRDYNLKIRNDKILYKPFLKRTSSGTQYGKKIKFNSMDELLPPEEESLNKQEFIEKMKNTGILVEIEKEAAIYKFACTPKLSLEFARIKLNNQFFFSLNIESKCVDWVQEISKTLIKNQPTIDYIDFIKTHLG